MNYQNSVFEKIKSAIDSDHEDWVDTIGEVLNISKSAVYKRIKGDTMLSMEDLVVLMNHYNFSFDELVFENKKQVGFRFPQENRKIKGFSDYIEPMKEFVISAKKMPDVHVQYATNELHFFMYFHDKDLLYFKFYVFAKSTWFLDSYKKEKFSLKNFREWPLIEEDVDMIMKTFYQIPGVEIWNGNVLDNFLNQIKYALESGYFKDPEEALLLCDKLKRSIEHINEMAKAGKKFLMGQSPDNGYGKFDMYHNEIIHTSNLLLVESSYANQIFFAFDNPNYILSDEKNLVKYTIEWFDRIKRNAIPISSAGGKNRNIYFNSLKKKIELTREQMANFIKYQL
jgi:hypothetical protein